MKLPDWLEPMAATLTEERFEEPDWLFERKYDGIRLLAYKRGDTVTLYSRTGSSSIASASRRQSQGCRSATRFSTAKSPADRTTSSTPCGWTGAM